MSLTSMFAKTPVAREIKSVVDVFDAPTEEYKQLAIKLGITTAIKTKTVTLEDVLKEELIHVYPMRDVNKYMGKITPPGKNWGWKPCRRIDLDRTKKILTYHPHNAAGVLLGEVYGRPIPYPALVTMDKIEEAAKAHSLPVSFFVSDYTARVPDPFLMVTVPIKGISQSEEIGNLWVMLPEPACFVVERWDEPSFR